MSDDTVSVLACVFALKLVICIVMLSRELELPMSQHQLRAGFYLGAIASTVISCAVLLALHFLA